MVTVKLFSQFTLPILLISLVITLLSGCTTQYREALEPTKITNLHQAYAWDLSGKLLVKTPKDKVSTNLYWLYSPKFNEMKLTTVLGTTVLSLDVTPNMTTIKVDNETYQDKNAQLLMNRLTGWSVPIKELPLWITGQFDENTIVLTRNINGQPKTVLTKTNTSLPWKITVKEWQHIQGITIPKLLIISRNKLELKIQINHWQALQPKLKSMNITH